MTEQQIQQATARYEAKLRVWLATQEGEEDGYEYEKSFLEFSRKAAQETLQIAVGELPGSKNKKKRVETSVGQLMAPSGHILHPGKGFGVSSYVRDLVCYTGQKEVFDEAEQTLKRLSGIAISDKQIERICHKYGAGLEQMEEDLESIPLKDNELHYGMADGSMILTREKDGKGKSKWAELKLGRVFKASANVALTDQGESRKWIRTSEYVGHLGDCDAFFEKFSVLLDPLISFIFIADGAKWIWERVGAFYPHAVQILDFYHAMEHLWAFIRLCRELNFDSQKARDEWVGEQKELLLKGQVEEVCKNIEALKVKDDKVLEKQVELLGYYENNKERMKYGEYLDNGWLVGSGPIESAHREVIQKRLKLSGQRWTRPGAQQIANLRVAYKSNQWDKVKKLIKIRA